MTAKRFVVALVLVATVLAPVAGVVAIGPAAAQQSAPSDMVGIPDNNVADARADADRDTLTPADLDAQASRYAGTTNVSIVTESQVTAVNAGGQSLPEVASQRVCSAPAAGDNQGNSPHDCETDTTAALVISDDVHHEGREVAVRAEPVREALGADPSFVTVRNAETGEEWERPVEIRDGWLIIDVEHFSSNTVSFTGEVSHSFSPATDGSSTQYELTDLDVADNFTMEATGTINEEWDNGSASGVDASGSDSISVGGNLEPVGPGASGDPVLELSAASGEQTTYDPVNVNGDGQASEEADGIAGKFQSTMVESEMRLEPDSSGRLTEVTIDVSDLNGVEEPDSFDVDVYLAEEGVDQDATDGQLVAEGWNPDWQTGEQTIVMDDPAHVDSDATYSLGISTNSVATDNSYAMLEVALDDSVSTTWSSWEDSSSWESQNMIYEMDTTIEQPPDVSASTSGGSADFGTVPFDGTSSEEIDISSSDSSIDFSASTSGSVDYTLRMQERTGTPSFGVSTNGNWANSTSLSNGETTSLTTDTSWLKSGTNDITVSMDESSLSGDAPDPQVTLEYSHDAVDKQTTTYAADQWVDRYNISRTYAADQHDASLVVPFDNNVYHLNSLEYRLDGGSWSTVDNGDYQLEGNDLDVDLAGVYGGTIPANTDVEVRTDASKVDPQNISLEVTNATDAGSKLDSEISVQSAGQDPRIGVGGTDSGTYAHYAYDATWQTDDHAVFDPDGGQELHLPETSAGNTFRVTHADTEVSPSSGDVEVAVESAGSEPELDVEPGPNGANTDVTFTHHRTTSGVDYVLFSDTNGIARDSATAQSPVTLSDDDSEETLLIQSESGGGNGSSAGGGGGFSVGQFQTPDPGTDWPLLVVAAAAALSILAIVQWRTGMNPITSAASSAAGAGSTLASRPRALAVLLVLGFAAALFTGVIQVGESVLAALTLAGVAAGSYVGLKRVGRFSMTAYLSIVGVSAFAVLAATGQLSAIFTALGPYSFVLVLGLLYIAYQYVQNRGTDQNINFNLRSE